MRILCRWTSRIVVLLPLISRIPSSNPTHPTIPDSKLLHRLRIINRIGIHALCLRHKEPRHDRPEQVRREEDPEHLGDANAVREPVEQDAGEDGAELADGGGEAVRQAADAGRVDFAGDDECGGVGAEVEEELGDAGRGLLERIGSEGL